VELSVLGLANVRFVVWQGKCCHIFLLRPILLTLKQRKKKKKMNARFVLRSPNSDLLSPNCASVVRWRIETLFTPLHGVELKKEEKVFGFLLSCDVPQKAKAPLGSDA
jgi:hypothetical protein